MHSPSDLQACQKHPNPRRVESRDLRELIDGTGFIKRLANRFLFRGEHAKLIRLARVSIPIGVVPAVTMASWALKRTDHIPRFGDERSDPFLE